MKNFHIKQKAAVIKTLKEPPHPKQKINWQRWFWMALLAYIIFSLAQYIFHGVAIVHGEGQVELSKQAITFTNDIQVIDILVTEGNTVKEGDTLFYYKNELDATLNNQVTVLNHQPIDWILKEKLTIQKQIELKKIQLDVFNERIAFKTEELQHQKELVLLGVNHIESTLTEIQAAILRAKAQEKALKNEISYLRKHLSKLKRQEKQMQKMEYHNIEHLAATQCYIAKMDGIIGQINFNNNEVCYEKQDVMTIHKMNNISIKAYFDPEEIPYVEKGDHLDIKFPDGSKGKGIVHNFYVSTYALPSEFQKKYEPTERNIVVDILPLHELEASKWTKFYKMTVDLSKERYAFLN